VASKFVQWINGVITVARCRYILDDLSNNINKLQLKVKKFGKTAGNMDFDNMLAMQNPTINNMYVSPRRSVKGVPQGPLLIPSEKTS